MRTMSYVCPSGCRHPEESCEHGCSVPKSGHTVHLTWDTVCPVCGKRPREVANADR